MRNVMQKLVNNLLRYCTVAVLPVVIVLFPSPGKTQVLGPILSDGDFELGAQYLDVHRDSENEELFNSYSGSAFFRFGLSRTATVSGELLVGNTRVFNSSWNSRYYVVGAGLQTRLWTEGKSLVTGGFHVTKSKRIRKDGEVCDGDYTTLLWSVLLERTFHLKQHDITPLAGPSYLYETEYVYSGINKCYETERHSVDNLGYIAGFNAIFYGHYQVFVHDIYAGYHQPRFGLSYRF